MNAEMDYSIIPVGERLVVRRILQERQGRVLLTEGSRDLGTEAEVVAVPGTTDYWEFRREAAGGEIQILALRVSYRIFISRFVGVPIDIDGTEENQLVIIKAEDVLGIKQPHKGEITSA